MTPEEQAEHFGKLWADECVAHGTTAAELRAARRWSKLWKEAATRYKRLRDYHRKRGMSLYNSLGNRMDRVTELTKERDEMWSTLSDAIALLDRTVRTNEEGVEFTGIAVRYNRMSHDLKLKRWSPYDSADGGPA